MNKLTHLFVYIFIVYSGVSYSQNLEEKKVQLRLKERGSFYAVTDRYELLTDTIFHTNDGFRVYNGYDIHKAEDGTEYVILSYPDWKGESQSYDKVRALESNASDDIPVHAELFKKNGLKIAMPKSDFDDLIDKKRIEDVYSLKWKYSTRISSGILTVPFKLRPKQDSVNFNMTTDVTIGSYIGVKKRITRTGDNHVIVPATLGLSYINASSNQTSNTTIEGSGIVPGWSWSTGIIFELSDFNIGFLLGQDYASGVGSDWRYQGKLWYSFAIGYSFFGKKDN